MMIGGKKTNPEDTLVLFVICVHNYDSDRPFPGFMMNKSCYSAHPNEKEVILLEGIPFIIMGTDSIYVDNNAAASDLGSEEQD